MKLYKTLLVLALLALPLAAQLASTPIITYDPDPAKGEGPVSIAVDLLGNKYVSLQPACQVRVYTQRWVERQRYTLPCEPGFKGASGMVVEPWGTIYVAVVGKDGIGGGVYKIEPWDKPEKIPGTEKILFPNSLAFDHLFGTLYVTDFVGGAVWRIRPHHPAELWSDAVELKSPAGFCSNGLVVHRGAAIVSVTYPAKIVRIPIQRDGSAGTPEVLVTTEALAAANVIALDDIALDLHGNIYATVPIPSSLARIAADGTAVAKVAEFDSPVTTLAFGRSWNDFQSVYVGLNNNVGFGGARSAVVRVDVGVPGHPVP